MNTTSRVVALGLITGLIMMVGAGRAWARIYYVAQDGQTPSPAARYSSWSTAASNIQDAVVDAWAHEPHTIWVHPGRYTAPTNAVLGYGVTNVVYFADKSMSLLATSTNPADTIIDGEGKNRGIAMIGGWWMLNGSPPDGRMLIQGFTITNCYATGSAGSGGGGGIMIQGGGETWTGVVQNCVIVNNAGAASAGGVYAYETTSRFSPVLSNCVIRGNSGIGVSSRTKLGGTTLIDSRFENNEGNGIYLYDGANRIENCVIRGNTNSGNWGGGISLWYGAHRFQNCLIYDNYCGGSPAGGAMSISSGCTPELYNCTLVTNRSAAGQVAGIYVHFNANVAAWNTILHDNKTVAGVVANGPPGDHWNGMAYFFFTNSCLNSTNGLIGSGNIEADPRFVDVAGQDFHLKRASPCLNTGTNQTWMVGGVDLDGLPRLDLGSLLVDMGCYELVSPRGTILLIR